MSHVCNKQSKLHSKIPKHPSRHQERVGRGGGGGGGGTGGRGGGRENQPGRCALGTNNHRVFCTVKVCAVEIKHELAYDETIQPPGPQKKKRRRLLQPTCFAKQELCATPRRD